MQKSKKLSGQVKSRKIVLPVFNEALLLFALIQLSPFGFWYWMVNITKKRVQNKTKRESCCCCFFLLCSCSSKNFTWLFYQLFLSVCACVFVWFDTWITKTEQWRRFKRVYLANNNNKVFVRKSNRNKKKPLNDIETTKVLQFDICNCTFCTNAWHAVVCWACVHVCVCGIDGGISRHVCEDNTRREEEKN